VKLSILDDELALTVCRDTASTHWHYCYSCELGCQVSAANLLLMELKASIESVDVYTVRQCLSVMTPFCDV